MELSDTNFHFCMLCTTLIYQDGLWKRLRMNIFMLGGHLKVSFLPAEVIKRHSAHQFIKIFSKWIESLLPFLLSGTLIPFLTKNS